MKTKDMILHTAKDMIAEMGYHRTTTANLAKRANISEGTIYRHFESKEDILLHILKELEEKYFRFIDDVRKKVSGRYGVLETVIRSHYDFVRENDLDIKIMLSSYGLIEASKKSMAAIIGRLTVLLEDSLEFAQGKGVVRKDVPPQETAMILVTIVFGLARLQLYWPDMEDVTKEAVEFVRRSLRINYKPATE